MDLRLKDRVCLVTGSTGGIGLETARLLAAEGARVVTSGRSDGAGRRARRCHVGADLRSRASPSGWSRALEALGGLDVPRQQRRRRRAARFEEVTDEQWDEMWQLNVMSYVRAIRAALPGCASAARARS